MCEFITIYIFIRVLCIHTHTHTRVYIYIEVYTCRMYYISRKKRAINSTHPPVTICITHSSEYTYISCYYTCNVNGCVINSGIVRNIPVYTYEFRTI